MAHLPADLGAHCRVAGVRDGQLRLSTDSPAWAARLRFQSARLVQQLRRDGSVTVRTVQVRILPPSRPRPRPVSKLRLSTSNAQLLEQTAAAVEDPGLATALRRLARRARDQD